ncbi:MAG: hypothetical protein PF444_06135 [Bacteroidales bacterium]|jgi:predicted Fe-Mo cluster-binding NifX family protein|nr:hypothetical protein [Bacteroidales bacterium]
MKILFPVVDAETNKEVLASGFHETKELCVFDSETYLFQHMSIDDLGGSMKNLPNALRELNIGSIISSGIRPLALQILERCGMNVYEPSGDDVKENLELFKEGYLERYSIQTSRGHLSTCGSSCSSCSSTSCS